VRRKPLPSQNAPSVIPQHRQSGPLSLSSSASTPGGDTPVDPSPANHHSDSPSSYYSSPVHDAPSASVPRNLDRYDSRSTLCSGPLTTLWLTPA
jgi:hypothetical protein